MAFMGHPVLADIRKGMRLRPTQTVDKSKPIIQAEGECVKIERCEPKPAAVPPPPPMAQQQKQQTAVRKPPPQNGAPPPPPAMQQQNGNRSGSRQPVGEDARQKLLAQIRTGGVRLRHVQTNDKSGLILDEEQQRDALRLRQNGTPHSLDSQGKSPSPSLAPSSAASALSPSPPVVWPAHSSLCSRDSSSDSSSAFQCPSPSPPPPTVFVHQKRERQPQPEADFQFDEQKLIADRREEVAALAHKGSASAKIAAFQKLQQQASSAASLSYCTLPRRMAHHQGQQQQNGAKALAGRAVPAKAAQSNSPASFTQQQQQQQQRQRRSPIPAAHGSAGVWTQQRRSPSPVDHFRAPQRHQRAVDNVANGQNGSCADRTLGRANSIGHGNSASVRLTSPHPMEPSPPARAPTPQGERLVLNTVWSSGNGEGVRQKCVVSRRSPSPVPLHRSSSSSMAFPPPSSPAPFFRPFAQRVPIGGTQSRQHFERIRGRFDRAPSGEATWKRAAQQRKQQQTAQSNDCSVLPPPPLPACSPPQLRSTSIFVGGGHQHPRDEGEQFAALRTGFAFAIDLDGDAEGKRLIRIVRR